MKYEVISAGEGSRLLKEGAVRPKPLTLLNGVVMIERLIRIFIANGASSVAVIINRESSEVSAFLHSLQKELPLDIVVKTTPSSMHSFHELAPLLEGDDFCLTTVDTIFKESEFSAYIEAFRVSQADGYMAVTDYIDDEKPLYVSTGTDLRITGFHDDAERGCKYISGGIYCLRPFSLDILAACVEKGMSRMRNFQKELVRQGADLVAYPFTKILDVDHVGDIAKAERFLSGKDMLR